MIAEQGILEGAGGRVDRVVRARRSSLVPLGSWGLSEAELEELGALPWTLDQNFPIDLGERRREEVLLDVGFKAERDRAWWTTPARLT